MSSRVHNVEGATGNPINQNRCTQGDVFVHCFCGIFVLSCIGLIGSFVMGLILDTGPPCPFAFKVLSLEVGPNHNNSFAGFNLTLDLTTGRNSQLLIDPLLVSIEYGKELVSSTKVDPVYMDSTSSTSSQDEKKVVLNVKDVITVDNEIVQFGFGMDLGRVEYSLVFDIRIHGGYNLYGGFSGHDHEVDVVCHGVKVEFMRESNFTSGTMINGPISCKERCS